MVVQSRPVEPADLDLGHLAFFTGLLINERVVEKMAALGFAETRQSHGYVIQHLIDSDRSITELAQRMEITQQAASKLVAEMVRLRIVELIPSPQDRRTKRVRLSQRGWQSVQQARKIRAQLEKQLVKRLGADRHASAKAALIEALAAFGGLDRIRTRRIRMAQ